MLTVDKLASLACATATLAVFACDPAAEFFGGSAMLYYILYMLCYTMI